MSKLRVHNEYFRTILPNRKSCPTCGQKLATGESIWSWGEYVVGKWNTVKHFCKECFPNEVKTLLINHSDECGCDFRLEGYRGETLPNWLTIPATFAVVQKKVLRKTPMIIKAGLKYELKPEFVNVNSAQFSYLKGVVEVENYAGGLVEFSSTSYPGIVQSMVDDDFVNVFKQLPVVQKKVLRKTPNGVYWLGSKDEKNPTAGSGRWEMFTVFTKTPDCKRGDYAEEIDVLVRGRSVAQAKATAQAAIAEDYVPELKVSKAVYRVPGFMFM